MITVYLVRHADYVSQGVLTGRLPFPLSEKGVAQAERLRDYFEDKNIEKIYSSAVERCKQTAEIIAGEVVPVEYDKRLLESFCATQGLKSDDWREFWGYRDELGGEDYDDVYKRVGDFWDEMSAKFEDGKNYIVCSHGDPLFEMLLYIKGEPSTKTPELDFMPEMPGYNSMGSVRIITGEKGKWEVGGLVEQEEI